MFFSVSEEFLLVGDEFLSEIRPQRVFGLGLVYEVDERLHHLVDAGGRLPVFRANDGQADLAFLVDVGVVDFGFEGEARRFERIFGGEDELDPEKPR